MSTETVPKGYKRTEVGVIPEDWEVKPVNDFGTIKTGPFGTLLKASEYTEHNGVPLISVGEVRNGHFRISDETPRIPEQVIRRLPQYVLKSGDIVFGRKGAVDRSAMVRKNENGWFLGSDGIAIRPSNELSQEYLGYQFQGSTTKNWLLQNAIGSTMPSLNQEILGRVIVAIPPTIAEQQAIAAALSDADSLIEALESLLAKKRQIKQGAMQELLTGKRRLPGFTGKWCEAVLNGFLLSPPDYGINAPAVPDTGAYPKYLRITDISDDGRFAPPVQTAVDHPESSRYILSKNEIVFARTGASVGKSYLYKEADGELVFAGFLIRAKIDPLKLSPEYLSAYTHTAEYWNWVRLMSMRSGQPGINGQEYASMCFRIPPTLPEQTAIASVLSDIDAELEALEAKLDKARQVKQGMMQQLLTGKVRLV